MESETNLSFYLENNNIENLYAYLKKMLGGSARCWMAIKTFAKKNVLPMGYGGTLRKHTNPRT